KSRRLPREYYDLTQVQSPKLEDAAHKGEYGPCPNEQSAEHGLRIDPAHYTEAADGTPVPARSIFHRLDNKHPIGHPSLFEFNGHASGLSSRLLLSDTMQSLRSGRSQAPRKSTRQSKLAKPGAGPTPRPRASDSHKPRVDDKIKKRMSMRYADIW
ncbi:hypothetical protein MPER_08082, partial [Moniliophthora perniciosa FA553]